MLDYCIKAQALRNAQSAAKRAGYSFTPLGYGVLSELWRQEPPTFSEKASLFGQCIRYALIRPPQLVLKWSVRFWPRWLLLYVRSKL